MCRLFAQISVAPRGVERPLASAPFSLLAQSDWNARSRQKDGWGVTYLNPASPEDGWTTVKSCNPIYKEKPAFRKLAKTLLSTAVLAHIRHASNPLNLPRRRLIGRNHTQPFRYKNLAFIHNGTLNIPQEVAKTLGGFRRNLSGNNDSEVLFLLIAQIWEKKRARKDGSADWPGIFKEVMNRLRQAWDKIPAAKRKHRRMAEGLNIVVSDGRSLAAQCSYRPSKDRSFASPKRHYFQMCYNKSNGIAQIASEPLDRSRGWRDLPNGSLLVIDISGKKLNEKITKGVLYGG